MPFISDADLASVGSAIEQLMENTCTILLYQDPTDEDTLITEPRYEDGPGFRCYVAPQGMQAWTAKDSGATTSVWWITLPVGSVVRTVDRIRVEETGLVYEVDAPQSPRTLLVANRIQCRLIQ